MGEGMMNLLSFQLKTMSGNFPSHKSKETNQFHCLPQHIPQGSYPTGNPMTCAEHNTHLFFIQNIFTILIG